MLKTIKHHFVKDCLQMLLTSVHGCSAAGNKIIYSEATNAIPMFKVKSQGRARFAEIWQKYFEFQILWSLSSVDFHTLTLQLPIQTQKSMASELQVFVHLKFQQNEHTPGNLCNSLVFCNITLNVVIFQD